MSDPINVMRQSPAEREAAKTHAERAEDTAYTLNHAISCGTTDMFIAPTIAALFGVQVGCSDPSHHHGPHDDHDHHDHDHHAHDHHDHAAHAEHAPDAHAGHTHVVVTKWPAFKSAETPPPAPALAPAPRPHFHASADTGVEKKFNWKDIRSNWKNLTWKMYREEAWHYLRAEIIGDILAVPLTIAVQRFFPSLMEGIRTLVEPVAAPFFHRGADAAAKKWGAKEGLAEDAPEVVARAEAMYRTEIKHLPQVAIWNAFAFTIGTGAQALAQHRAGGTDWQKVRRIMRNKTIGAVISNGLLLGGRAIVPNIAQRWDAMNSAHIIAPVTGLVGSAIGLKQADIAAVTQPSWAERVERAPEKEERTP